VVVVKMPEIHHFRRGRSGCCSLSGGGSFLVVVGDFLPFFCWRDLLGRLPKIARREQKLPAPAYVRSFASRATNFAYLW